MLQRTLHPGENARPLRIGGSSGLSGVVQGIRNDIRPRYRRICAAESRYAAVLKASVFSKNGQAAKLKMVLASQGASGDNTSSLQYIVENARFQNSSVAALSGANAPITRADVVSYALYYAGQTTRSTDSQWSSILARVQGPLKQAVDRFLTGDATMVSQAFAWMAQDFLANEAIYAAGRFTNWNGLAKKYGKEVRLYECNHEITAPSDTWCSTNLADASYGNTASAIGKIQRFFNAFFDSAQYQAVVAKYLQDFYSLSQSTGFSVSAFCAPSPWLVFPKSVQSDGTGDSLQRPYGNWRANVNWNASH
ncbi:hypothetical protein [Bradyrhizobium sp.]|uniref:hypothetical protein n=1 Tax=Bradyrhizobium sp. TaxID=376 RepID=UPI0012E8D08D|nr:hypothetical protein [Bradyrhizobium sp.]